MEEEALEASVLEPRLPPQHRPRRPPVEGSLLEELGVEGDSRSGEELQLQLLPLPQLPLGLGKICS